MLPSKEHSHESTSLFIKKSIQETDPKTKAQENSFNKFCCLQNLLLLLNALAIYLSSFCKPKGIQFKCHPTAVKKHRFQHLKRKREKNVCQSWIQTQYCPQVVKGMHINSTVLPFMDLVKIWPIPLPPVSCPAMYHGTTQLITLFLVNRGFSLPILPYYLSLRVRMAQLEVG